MISDRWEDDVFSELERLGTLIERIDSAGDVHKTPELRVILEGNGQSARVMDNRRKAFVTRLAAEKVLIALSVLPAAAGTDAALEALVNAAVAQD